MIVFHGLSLATVLCWLIAFPGGLITAIIFFNTKFWKNLNQYFSEWNLDDLKNFENKNEKRK